MDTVPTARIISRCTQDLRDVDGAIPEFFADLANNSLTILVKFAAVAIFVPAFILPGLAMVIVGALCRCTSMRNSP
jgi:hypothetical protein